MHHEDDAAPAAEALEPTAERPLPLDQTDAPAPEAAPVEDEHLDEATPEGDAPAELTEEERAAAAAAEKARAEEEAAAARRAAEAAERERRAAAAVAVLDVGAGFVTQAGVYYDARQGTAPATPAPRHEEELGDETTEERTNEEAAGYVDPQLFRRQVAKLTEAITRQSLHREIYYRVLAFCADESQPLRTIEEYVAGLAPFKQAANSPYHFIEVLETAGGLERFELDEEGEVVTAERCEGLSEDEIDDLVVDFSFMTTPAGLAVVEQHTPRARLIELLDLVPERRESYVDVLAFCAHEPRSYNEICQLLQGRDALVRLVNGEPQTMQPSVFIDKLEAAAAVEWRDGWVLTDEGRAYLAELEEAAPQV